MPGELQPLAQNFAIVDENGFPTLYFIKWAQQRQIDIGEGITAAQAQQLIDDWATARQVIAGVGLDGGGALDTDITIDLADTVVTPGTYGDATHSAQLTIDQQGRVTDAVEVPISGGGGGGGFWWFNPPLLADFTLASGDATNLIATDDADVGLTMDGGAIVGGNVKRVAYKALPAGDWDLKIRLPIWMPNTDFVWAGPFVWDSVSDKGVMIEHGDTSNGLKRISNWNSPFLTGGFAGASGGLTEVGTERATWSRITRVGANLTFSISIDGKVWIVLLTVSATAFMGNPPDRIGMLVGMAAGSTLHMTMYCDAWDQDW